MNYQPQVIPLTELNEVPIGSIISVGRRIYPVRYLGQPLSSFPEPDPNFVDNDDDKKSSIWRVIAPGKATLLDEHYPYSETEDMDWFACWEVKLLIGELD